MSEYPEHDKLKAVQADSQVQGEFLEWLMSEKGIYLGQGIEEILAEYHAIDLNKIEAEKLDILQKSGKTACRGWRASTS